MTKILDVLLLSYFIIEQLGNKVHYMKHLLSYVAAPVISIPPVACPPPLRTAENNIKLKNYNPRKILLIAFLFYFVTCKELIWSGSHWSYHTSHLISETIKKHASIKPSIPGDTAIKNVIRLNRTLLKKMCWKCRNIGTVKTGKLCSHNEV